MHRTGGSGRLGRNTLPRADQKPGFSGLHRAACNRVLKWAAAQRSYSWRDAAARRLGIGICRKRCHSFGERGSELGMYTHAYKSTVSLPPLLWVGIFLLVPYALLFCYSFWAVSEGQIVRHWNFKNYVELLRTPVYLSVLMRSMKIAGMVTCFTLLLAYPLAYYLSLYAHRRKDLLYQLVIIPLWVSYLVRAYAWKTILGSDGVLNTLLQYVHLTHHPLDFLLYSPFAVVLTLNHIYTPFTILPIYASIEP